MATDADRYVSMDAVRGFAVLGILLMNIVSMGLSGYAYVNPTWHGGAEGANLWVWATNFTIADGKMRALFTMLYGASMLLIAQRAMRPGGLGPNQTHYRRSFWLLLFGAAHGVLLWYGDILMFYAVAGALAFPLRKLSPKVLLGAGIAIYLGLTAFELYDHAPVERIRAAAMAPGATPAQTAAWQEAQARLGPPPEVLQMDLKAFRGGFVEATKQRAFMMVLRHTVISPLEYVEAFALILAGMGLFQLGFFTLGWSTRAYWGLIAAGYLVAVPITAWLASQIVASGFDRSVNSGMMYWSSLPRLFIAMAHASVVMLLVRAGALRWLTERLAAAGRMAFSNYIGTSLITSLIFNGYGLGLFGYLERHQLYFVVAAIWVGALLWSKPWLERFHYGPLEWVWRSLVQWKRQPFSRGAGPRLATA